MSARIIELLEAIERGEVIHARESNTDVMTQKRCGEGKDAPREKRCPYLRKDGQCRTFRCTSCKRSYPWCQGSADDQPNWCDGCKVREGHIEVIPKTRKRGRR